MSINEKFKGFDIITDTVFLKDFSKENVNLKKLEEISRTVSDFKIKKTIDRDISLLKWGLEGENNVYFELKNSFLPMICFHDIRIEVGDLSAQIDFLVLTNKFFYIFETKHLVGDIEINKDGDFIRITKDEFGNKKEEGMYNPITQGNRHARILKKFFESKNIFNIPDFPIKSIAILANPKTILNKDMAPKHIKDNLYRNDQIVHFLQNEFNNNEFEIMISDSKLNYIANKILENDSPLNYNFEAKYKIKNNLESTKTNYSKKFDITKSDEVKLNTNSIEDKIKIELKNLRKTKSKELSLKAYELFTNKQLDLIVKHMPKTLVELNSLDIIPKKGSTYLGYNIVNILNKYSIQDNNKKVSSYELNNYLKKLLKDYRRNKAKSLSIDAYKIFTNNQLDELLKIKPKTFDELNIISGFKNYHIYNYGEDILNILKTKKDDF